MPSNNHFRPTPPPQRNAGSIAYSLTDLIETEFNRKFGTKHDDMLTKLRMVFDNAERRALAEVVAAAILTSKTTKTTARRPPVRKLKPQPPKERHDKVQ